MKEIFFFSSRTTRRWTRRVSVGYFEKKKENKEKKKLCVGNGIKIKLRERRRGGEGAENGREKECAPDWQLSMIDEGTCLTREKELERDIKGGGKKAVKFYFFLLLFPLYRCSFSLCL